VIDADGFARIGVWGQTVPVAGEQVVSVRQNLPPLVANGVASPTVSDAAAWGEMLGPGPAVPRSGLGEDAEGNLLYAGGMSLDPSDLAAGLVDAGATTAMELDITPSGSKPMPPPLRRASYGNGPGTKPAGRSI